MLKKKKNPRRKNCGHAWYLEFSLGAAHRNQRDIIWKTHSAHLKYLMIYEHILK